MTMLSMGLLATVNREGEDGKVKDLHGERLRVFFACDPVVRINVLV